MILIIGGASSGKKTYARSLGYADSDMADAVIDNRPVIYNLQDLVSADAVRADMLIDALLEKEVVICNEVGSGIIPLERRDRKAREAVGRLCVLLAQRADTVVRMVSGIPVIIKEKLQ